MIHNLVVRLGEYYDITNMKNIIKQIIGAFISMIVNTIITILATKAIDFLYNRFMDKPMCFLCGGTGWRNRTDGDGRPMKVRCTCRHRKPIWKML